MSIEQFGRIPQPPVQHTLEANWLQYRAGFEGMDLEATSTEFKEQRFAMSALHHRTLAYTDQEQRLLQPGIRCLYNFLGEILPEDDKDPLFLHPIDPRLLGEAGLLSHRAIAGINRRYEARKQRKDIFEPTSTLVAIRSRKHSDSFLLKVVHTDEIRDFTINGRPQSVEYHDSVYYGLGPHELKRIGRSQNNPHVHVPFGFPDGSPEVNTRFPISENDFNWRRHIPSQHNSLSVVGPKELAIVLFHFEQNTQLRRFP